MSNKKSEEATKTTTYTLEDIENRVKKNSAQYGKAIRQFENNLDQRNLKSGRWRPKDPTEAKILKRFNLK